MNVVSESMPAVHSPATLPILHVDFSRLVTEVVECGAASVLAVVDTGAAVTVISPPNFWKKLDSGPCHGTARGSSWQTDLRHIQSVRLIL